MATNLLTGESENVAQDKPKNLLPEFTQIQENSNEVSNVERGKNLFNVANETSNKYDMAIKTAINYEDTKSKSDLVGGLTVFMQGLKRLPVELQASVLKLHQGAEGASVVEKNWMQRFLVEADTDSEKFMADIFAKYGETKIVPKIPIKITDVAALPQNLAFSIVSMGSGAAAGIPIGLLPVPGARVAAWALGTVASGKAAYEMSTYEIMQTYLEVMNEQEIAETGKGITLEKEKELKDIFNFEAMKYGLWEAVPEALSNLAFAKLLTAPLAKMVGKGVTGKMINKIVGIYGGELITETITQKGQAEIELRAGLRTGEDISFVQAFKEVAPQTFLLTSVMAGAGSSSVAIKNRVQLSLNREVLEKKIKPEDVETAQQGMEEHVDSIINEKDDIQSGIDQKTQESVTGTPIAAEEGVPGAPEGPVGAEPGIPGAEEGVPAKPATPAERLAKLEEREAARGQLQDVLAQEERLQEISELFKTKPLQAIEEAAEAGFNIKTESDLQDLIADSKQRGVFLKERIQKLAPEEVVRKDITVLRQKVRDIQRGIREGKVLTKEEVKQVQANIIDIINDSNLEAKDKAKFIPLIKNTQTREQFLKVIPELEARIEKLAEKAAKRKIKAKIKDVLESTKVKKQAGKIVGRFTPEGEAILKNLRKISKLNAETAQDMLDKNMEIIGDKIPTFEQALENSMLSFMADSESVTVRDMDQLLKDINLIKESGFGIAQKGIFARQAQDAQNKQDVFEVLTKGEVVPEGKIYQQGIDDKGKTFKEVIDAVRVKFLQLGKTISGWNDIMDMLSFKDKGSLVGRSTLNQIMKVSNVETAEKKIKRIQTEKLVDFTKKSFGFKNEKQLVKQFREDNRVVNLGTFRNTQGIKQELKYSKAEARKIWMEMNDPSLTETFTEGMFFTQDMKDAISEGFLTEKDKTFAREQLKFYTEFYNEVNPVYRMIYGIDLPFNPFYSPIAREGVSTKGEAVDFLGEMQHRRSIATGNLKTRVKNILPLKKQSDLRAIQKHIIEMAHFMAWAEKIRSINAVFKDPTIRTQISKFHGKAILPIIDKHIETFTTGGKTDATNFNAIDRLRVNYTTSVLGGIFAGKPALMMKQLVSFLAFSDEISVKDFTIGVADFIRHPIISTKILAESEFVKARGRNITRDMSDAMKSQEFQLMVKVPSLKNKMMFMTRFGDMGAIMLGGWSVYKSVLAETGSEAKAMEAFEDAASSAQQSADLSQLSVWQKGGSFAKLFTMFTTSQNQYFRKEMGAIRGLLTGRGTITENAKKIVLYHFILPMFFQFVASGFKWDDDEQLRAGILGSFNGVFILKDILDGLIRAAIGMKDYKKGLAIMANFDKVETAIRKMKVDDIEEGELIAAAGDIVAAGIGIGTGLPAKDVLTKIEALKELESGEIIKGGKIMFGWSPYVISQGEKKSGKKLIR